MINFILLITFSLSVFASSQTNLNTDLNSRFVLDDTWEYRRGVFSTSTEDKNPGDFLSALEPTEIVKGYWPFLLSKGGGTYLKTIHLNSDQQKIGLFIPVINSAYHLFWNGKQVASAGSPNLVKERHLPESKIRFVSVDAKAVNELKLHVSNYEFPTGEVQEPIQLFAKVSGLIDARNNHIFAFTLVFAILLFIAFFHSVLFLFLQQQKINLYLSLISVLVAISILFDPKALYSFFQPLHIGFDWQQRIGIVLVLLQATLFLYFFEQWHQRKGKRSITDIFKAGFWGLAGIFLIIPIEYVLQLEKPALILTMTSYLTAACLILRWHFLKSSQATGVMCAVFMLVLVSAMDLFFDYIGVSMGFLHPGVLAGFIVFLSVTVTVEVSRTVKIVDKQRSRIIELEAELQSTHLLENNTVEPNESAAALEDQTRILKSEEEAINTQKMPSSSVEIVDSNSTLHEKRDKDVQKPLPTPIPEAIKTIIAQIDKIVYLKSAQNYVALYTNENRNEFNIVRSTLNEVNTYLDDHFVRINRSTLLKISEVAGLTTSKQSFYIRTRKELTNDIVLKLSKNYLKEFITKVNDSQIKQYILSHKFAHSSHQYKN